MIALIAALAFQCPDGAPPPCRVGPAPATVAVLYFDNASHDSADTYLADGITEDIISRLGGVPRIQVKSRYLVQRFRGAVTRSPTDIGHQLAVTSIVTGSVRRSGNRIRVTAEMVRTATGDVMWSERYDRADTDVLALQDDLAGAVAAAITGRLLPAERRAIGARPVGGTGNPAAYNAYLLGRFYWSKRTADDLVRAAGYFNQAIRADSAYAQAWSGLADSYVLYVPEEYNVPGVNRDSMLGLAEGAARRAMALAPALGEAWSSLGEILEYRWKWTEARQAFERGATLGPGYPTAHLWYGYDLLVWNRVDDAIRELGRARELDPFNMLNTLSLGAAYDAAERWTDADARHDEAHAMAPDHALVIGFGALHHLLRRNFERLATTFAAFARQMGADSSQAADLQRRIGDPATRSAALRESLALPGTPIAWRVLVIQALDGDDEVLRYLGTLVGGPPRADVGSILFSGVVGPRLRSDPRMQAVLVQLGYPATR